MTPLRRIIERVALPSLVSILFVVAGSARCAGAAPRDRTPRETIAYVPGAIWGPWIESATAELNLDRFAIYWFDGSDAMGRIIGDRERYEADDAKAAPREALVAFVGRYAAYPSNKLVPGVAVMDTTGALVADFPGAKSYAWNRDGSRLAVIFTKELLARPKSRKGRKGATAARAPRYRPGVVVWDRENGSVRSYAQWPSRAAWGDADSLLIQLPDRVAAIDARRGTVSPTGYRGTIVSPDARYSMWPGEAGKDTQIYHEASGVSYTDGLFGPFRSRDMGQIRSAFWVRARGANHLMCISACEGIQHPRPSCRTEIIDVETSEKAESFVGEAIGPTADERGVVVFRRSRGRLEFHDLRSVAREWSPALTGSARDAREPDRSDRESTESDIFH